MTPLRILLVLGLVSSWLAGQQPPDRKRVAEIQDKVRSGATVTPEERAVLQEAQRWQREQYAKNNPPRESTGLIPLPDLGPRTYKGEEGGLYPGGKNTPPAAHLEAGLQIARNLRPLDADGNPSADGKIVLLSVGMSNTTMEFSMFQKVAASQQGLNSRLVIVDGAQGGQTAMITAKPESRYWTVSEERLRAAGVSPKQVQVAWIKQANGGPQKGWPDETRRLKEDVLSTIATLRAKCPNVKMVYLSSRIYAGYAASPLNPEPYAYEGAFAMKWIIADQIAGKPELNFDARKGEVRAPWIAWGPYLWTDGLKGRKSDDVIWKKEDTAEDGTHPSQTGRDKVARMLLAFLRNEPTARYWFLEARMPAGTRVLRDLPYVTNGHERQKLDLYLPAEGKNWPLIVAVHGGAWLSGSKENEPAGAFVAKGFAVAAVNYRLSQHAVFPAQIQDCKAAVRWLRAHAAEYGYDAQRFGAYGTSAGGHLVALLGTAGGVKEFETGENLDQSSRVQAVADFFGPTDFLQMDAHRHGPAAFQHGVPQSPESKLVGGLIDENPDKVARANPITYVGKDTPPFLIVHGDSDLLVPHHQSELMDVALRKSGIPVKLITIEGGPHGGPTVTKGLPEALAFFAKTLKNGQ